MKTFIVDSFTDAPFKGNPAGVCIVESQLSEAIMLRVAQELNLSETAFIRPLIQPMETSNTFAIRFFSPKMEIPLCGHATLASAKVVFTTSELNEVHFINIQNLDLSAKESEGQIVMEFPVYETRASDAPPALLAALGINAVKNDRRYSHLPGKILVAKTVQGKNEVLSVVKANGFHGSGTDRGQIADQRPGSHRSRRPANNK